jgi:hypothetical protein
MILALNRKYFHTDDAELLQRLVDVGLQVIPSCDICGDDSCFFKKKENYACFACEDFIAAGPYGVMLK